MNGFAGGILKYNQDHGTDVRLLGWNPATQSGTFVSQFSKQGFADPAAAGKITGALVAQRADIILPVAGGSDLGAGQPASDAGNVLLIGVDTDQFFSAPQFADLWLTSIEKRYDVVVEAVMRQVVDGTFAGGRYVGTLNNGGVSLAPFHDLDPSVPTLLRDELARVKAGIADGTISVDPRDYLP